MATVHSIIIAFVLVTHQSGCINHGTNDTLIEMASLLQSNHSSYGSNGTPKSSFINHSDIHSLRTSSASMYDNQALLTHSNCRYLNHELFLQRSFHSLLNATGLTMDDLKRIPLTEPLMIKPSHLECFMHRDTHKSSIFIGINNVNNKSFIAFTLRPVNKGYHDFDNFDDNTILRFVFDGSNRVNLYFPIYLPNINIYKLSNIGRLLRCAELVKVGSTSISTSISTPSIPLVLQNKSMTVNYFIHRHPDYSLFILLLSCASVLIMLLKYVACLKRDHDHHIDCGIMQWSSI
eukprot:874865_1